ncbi:MAG TPA: hypothetical protein VNE60_12245 [Gemmatimonadaceae bacterium]|nr:hypothetical protein [Gemmatimonadaceae bacterium]
MLQQFCSDPDYTALKPGRRSLHELLRHGATWIRIGFVASALSACASLQPGASSLGTLRYSAFVPSPALGAPAASAAVGRPELRRSNVVIRDSILGETIARMRAQSPSFDSAMVAIEQSGIPVVIGTRRELRDQVPPGYRSVGGWQAVTAIYPLTPTNAPGRPIDHFSVIIRMSELRHALLDVGATSADSTMFDRYIERVLGHEIYGHLWPQLESHRTAPIACDDPTSGADWYDACVMKRERHVVAELTMARGTGATLGTR